MPNAHTLCIERVDTRCALREVDTWCALRGVDTRCAFPMHNVWGGHTLPMREVDTHCAMVDTRCPHRCAPNAHMCALGGVDTQCALGGVDTRCAFPMHNCALGEVHLPGVDTTLCTPWEGWTTCVHPWEGWTHVVH